MENKDKFIPEHCDGCGQSTEYKLGLDRGSAKIVLAIMEIMARKDVNEIHPARELALRRDEVWFLTNLSRPRFHGLIAYIEEKQGYYCLTRKAGEFLRDREIWKYAVIDKTTGHKKRYWEAGGTTSLSKLMKESYTWSGDQERFINRLDPENGQARLL